MKNNPLDFSTKVALVTGAAAGMGLATAQAFAEAGAAVVMADFREDAVSAETQKLDPLCLDEKPRARAARR